MDGYGISGKHCTLESARLPRYDCNIIQAAQSENSVVLNFAESVFSRGHAVGLQEHPVKMALVFIADRLYDFGDAHIRRAQQPFRCFQPFVGEKFAEGFPENLMDPPRDVFAAVA